MPQLPEVVSRAHLPPALRELDSPPKKLFLLGNLGHIPRVAVVGTRHPTQPAWDFAHRMGRELAAAGVTVLSGGAEGIDRAAHEGALAAARAAETEHGGRPHASVVVAPCSFDRPYPEGHGALFQAIVDAGGGFVSEHRAEVVARRHHFFRRNELLVALSELVVLVQAPIRSGARNAAKWARSFGRPVLVVPTCPWVSQGLGSNQELQRGAELCLGPADVLRALRVRGCVPVGAASLAASGSAPKRGRLLRAPVLQSPLAAGSPQVALEDELLAALADGPLHVDDVASRLGISVAEAQLGALQLCLQGAVTFALGVVARVGSTES